VVWEGGSREAPPYPDLPSRDRKEAVGKSHSLTVTALTETWHTYPREA
jgi:hypothetical protein